MLSFIDSWEGSGSMVECFTWDWEAAGSSLTGITALCPSARHINPSLVLAQPRWTRPYITERLLMGRKKQIKIQLTPILYSNWWSNIVTWKTILLCFAVPIFFLFYDFTCLYPRYEVYRGYIVFAFSVIMFVCLSVCLFVCKLFFSSKISQQLLGLGFWNLVQGLIVMSCIV